MCKFAWGPRCILGGKWSNPDPFLVRVSVLATNHCEGMRTGGNKDHQSLQRGAHCDGEFCTGDPGPIAAPRRPQRGRVPTECEPEDGSTYFVPPWIQLPCPLGSASGMRIGMNVNQKSCSLGAHMWAAGLVGPFFQQWGPGLAWTTLVQWDHRPVIKGAAALTQSPLTNWFNSLTLSAWCLKTELTPLDWISPYYPGKIGGEKSASKERFWTSCTCETSTDS